MALRVEIGGGWSALRVEIGGGWMAMRVEIFIIEHASYLPCYIRIANTKQTENKCLRQHVRLE